MRDNRDILEKLRWLSDDMEEMEVPGEWLLPVTEARNIIFRLREQQQSAGQLSEKNEIKMQRWRGALVNIAQGKGDPAALASAALELDND